VSERALLEEQYGNPSNLRARISLRERFSTNPGSYPRWVFDGYGCVRASLDTLVLRLSRWRR